MTCVKFHIDHISCFHRCAQKGDASGNLGKPRNGDMLRQIKCYLVIYYFATKLRGAENP